MRRYLTVAVYAAIARTLTYSYETQDNARLCGRRAAVPLGTKSITGLIIEESKDAPDGFAAEKIKKVISIIDDEPVISDELMKLGLWVASYYSASPGMVFATILSALKKVKPKKRALLLDASGDHDALEKSIVEYLATRRGKKAFFGDIIEHCGFKDTLKTLALLESKKIIQITDLVNVPKSRNAAGPLLRLPSVKQKIIELNNEQKKAVTEINEAIRTKIFSPYLLLGVTGSGKTEIYIRAARACVETGRSVIMLVPEIFLTPQTVSRFLETFEAETAVLHSGLSDNERAAQWEMIRSGKVKVAIGTRSAVFAPFDNLGLIIVDEEFDTSYKQDNEPRYSGRDTAVYRAKLCNATVILGSATPSLETWQNAKSGKYKMIKLTARANNKPMPEIKVVDMRLDWNGGMDMFLSDTLAAGLRQTMDEGGQAVIFINRRGFSSFVHCARCGYVAKCPDCGIPLVFHKRSNELICHYCNYNMEPPVMCPDCGKPVFYSGVGTQKVEEVLGKFFPDKVIKRIDLDSATGFESYTQLYEDIKNRKVDIIVGTQMIAKGFDFPDVSFAGVVGIDSMLNLPDFRSEERVFQLLTQVAGRAGRAETPGRVVVQTFNPDSLGVKCAVNYDTEGFYESQLKLRRMLRYPPFSKLMQAIIKHKEMEKAFGQADKLTDLLEKELKAAKITDAEILGPSEAPLAMLKGKHRISIVIKAQKAKTIAFCADIIKRESRGIEIAVNIDPMNTL